MLAALLTGAALAGPLILPEPGVGVGAEDGWWRLQGAWGVQNVLFLGQPTSPQPMVEGRLGWDRYAVYAQVAGLGTPVWGGLGLRAELLDPERAPVGVVLDHLVSLPTRTTLHLGLGLTVGQDRARWGWVAGTQLGAMFAPYPNQRPLGANLLLDGYGGVWGRLWPWLTVNLDLTTTTFVTTALPGVVLDLSGFDLGRAGALGGLQLKVMEPVNVVHVLPYASELGSGEAVGARGRLQVLTPAVALRYQGRLP
ncbi:MAG: hypothetical protein H6739_31020 [Alphaproteobacteria bacterium]|nr:hypothetical protein [Alphaproteobacteria bacterium]